MFALRASARLLSTSVPTLARATPKFATRAFSNNLTSVLQKEIDAAKEDLASNEDNAEFNEFKKDIERLFKIEEHPGKTDVKMTRQHKNESITVTFNCQDTSEEYNEPEEEEREDETEELELGVNFQATVEKGGNKVTAHCVAGPQGLRIRFLQKGDLDNDNIYTGPEFSTLDESLQEELFKWLDDRRIDDDLSVFVHAFAQQKEHKEYLLWLQDMNSFFTAK